MTLLQQYYTSFVDQEGGRAGFQIKAMSPEISPETQGIISRLLAYHIPTGVDERAVKTHPVALRYYYHNAREGILLCSQSCGSDENGRPGNFFAHSLVISPHTFTYQPPILYWRSPFWQHNPRSVNALVPLSERDMLPSATLIKQMWAFLAEKRRTEAFYSLMCAVVHSKRTGQRIIILDSDEHVALWIAAVSCMLPPMYRPLLSFSTYYHDPYQSWFLITGTSDPLAVHTSLEVSASHFILDGRTNQTSGVQPSDYADLVRSLCNRDDYSQTLLQYFVECERRFPGPAAVDDSLEMLATYIRIRAQEQPAKLKISWLPTISTILDSFENLPTYEDEDEQELLLWIDILDASRHELATAAVLSLYQRSMKLYKKYKAPSNTMLIRDLKDYTQSLLQPEPIASIGIEALRELRETYGEATFIDLVNQRAYVLHLVKVTQNASSQPLWHMWMYLGPYLKPVTHYQNVFVHSIYIWGRLREQKSSNAKQLLDAIKFGIGSHETSWFALLIDTSPLPATTVLADFYWQYVKQKALEEREAYRESIGLIVPGLVDSEFYADLAHANVQDKIAMLSQWVTYTRQTGLKSCTSVVGEGLHYLQKQHKAQWPTFCMQVLSSAEIFPYLEKWEAVLVQDWFMTIGLRDFSNAYASLYTRYQNHETLSAQQKHILTGLMVLVNGQFDADSILSVHNYLNSLSADTYFMEVYGFISASLQLTISIEQHTDMISACFLNKYASYFWLAYWQTINTMLIRLLTADMEGVVRLFSFWFTYLPAQFTQPDQTYVVQQFFLTLSQHLHSVQALPDASSALENLSSKAATHSWYPIVQDLLVIEKKNFVKKGQEWMRIMQQRLSSHQKKQYDEGELKLNRDIEQLTQKGYVRERHVQNMLHLYLSAGHQPFWDAYKEHLQHILCSNNAEHVLEIFGFWFEDAFKSFGQEPYLAQSFLSKITSVFEATWKGHEGQIKKSVQQLTTAYKQISPQNNLYDWYPLLQQVVLSKDVN